MKNENVMVLSWLYHEQHRVYRENAYENFKRSIIARELKTNEPVVLKINNYLMTLFATAFTKV